MSDVSFAAQDSFPGYSHRYDENDRHKTNECPDGLALYGFGKNAK